MGVLIHLIRVHVTIFFVFSDSPLPSRDNEVFFFSVISDFTPIRKSSVDLANQVQYCSWLYCTVVLYHFILDLITLHPSVLNRPFSRS